MTFAAMLDTNIVSSIIRQPDGSAAQRLRRQASGTTCMSIVTLAELRFGAARVASVRISNKIDQLLELVPALPLETPAEDRYAEIRTELQRLGTPIGGNDLLIAAHALALDLPLVTANLGEFSRVPDLRLENWLD